MFSMDHLEPQKVVLQSFAPKPSSPLRNPEKSPPQQSIMDTGSSALFSSESELSGSTDCRETSHSSSSRRKTAFGSISDFLSGFISKKAVKDRGMSANGSEPPLADRGVTSPPLPPFEVEFTHDKNLHSLNARDSARHYQLISVPIGSGVKPVTSHVSAEQVSSAQLVDANDTLTNSGKIFTTILLYDQLLDALCEQKEQPHLFIVIVIDPKTKHTDSTALGSSIKAAVSDPIAIGSSALTQASSFASSRACSPHPLISDLQIWRSHAFLDQDLVSQYTTRPGFDQVEHECAAKCAQFSWDKLEADPTSDALNAKFREVVKFGVPMAYRRTVWLKLSGIKEQELPALQELYHNRLMTYLGENGPTRIIRYLPHFGQQILWENAHLINESGRHAAFRILTVVALAHQPKLAFFPMLQDLVGCLLCFLSESETFFVIDGLIHSEIARLATNDESFPIVLLSTTSESLIAGLVIDSLRQDLKDVAQSISHATLNIDGKPSWDSASPYLWGMLQGWLRNIWVGHAPLDLAFRSVDLILMKAFDQLALLKLAVLEHLASALKVEVAASPSSGESNHGAGIMPMFKALNIISPAEIHSVAQRGFFELKINPVKALSRLQKSKISPPVPVSPIAPQSTRCGNKFLGDYTMYYLPKPLPSSSIVRDEHFEFIWKHLDERFKTSEDVRRVFNSREHGLSLTVSLHVLFVFPLSCLLIVVAGTVRLQ
jgi:hypothetical protein